MAAASIVVVDDFKAWRLKLRSILEAVPGFSVVAEAGDGLEAIEQTAHLRPDIVLLDIGMPLLNGIEAARKIQRISANTKIIFLTQEDDGEVRAAALATGAKAYLLKSRANTELIAAIDSALMSVREPQALDLRPSACLVSG